VVPRCSSIAPRPLASRRKTWAAEEEAQSRPRLVRAERRVDAERPRREGNHPDETIRRQRGDDARQQPIQARRDRRARRTARQGRKFAFRIADHEDDQRDRHE